MRPGPRWWGIRRLLGQDRARDIEAEIEHHIELRTQDLIGSGLSPAAARAEALRRFGDRQQVARELARIDRIVVRRRRLADWVTDLRHDVRFAVRGLGRNPGFALAVVLTLGLGMGANAAVFSAVNQTLLRPLPVGAPDRLAMVWEENPERGWVQGTVAASNFLDWRERVSAFSDVAAYADFADEVTLSTGSGTPQVIRSQMMTGNLFEVLGVEPEAGRLPRFEDSWGDTPPVAVLSHGAWIGSFGGSGDIVGRTIRLDGESYEVVGVLPESFSLPGFDTDVWVTMGWARAAVADPSFRRAHWLRAIGRLAPGASHEEAANQLRAVAAQLEAEYPETNRLMGAGSTPLQEFLVGDRRVTLLALFAAVGLLLALSCMNVGNLLLVRGLERHRELAVRNALGAGLRRLLRQAAVEGLVLATASAIVGLGLGWAMLRILNATQGSTGLLAGAMHLDTAFLAYMAAITLASAFLFSLVPALFATKAQLGSVLRGSGRGVSSGRRGRRIAAGLVAAEVALAFVLLAGASLLGRTYLQLRQVDPGFDSSGVLSASISLPDAQYPDDADVTAFFDRLLERAGALPGVTHAGLVRQLPLTGVSWSSDFSVFGRAADEYGVEVLHREIAGDYFGVLRIPLVGGRLFAPTDDASAEPVIIINEVLARTHFPDSDAVGQRLAFTRSPTAGFRWWTIVGVVGSERQGALSAEPRMEIFAPLAQDPTRGMTLVARTQTPPSALAGPLRSVIDELDPELGIFDLRTLDEVRLAATAREQFLALLLMAFGGIALVLAVVGVYGVISQSLKQRRREIGIRMAVGAVKAHIVGMVTRQTLGILGLGIAAGLVGALLMSRAIGALLYGVSPLDPVSLLVTPVLLILAGLAAAAAPAMQASRADPSVVLREE